MSRKWIFIVIICLFFVSCSGNEEEYQLIKPVEGEITAEIVVEKFGTFKVRLFPNKAPKAVENFLTHAQNGYYDGTLFHRVIPDFMLQGGIPSGSGDTEESIWGGTFEDEFSEDLHAYRGALCMANNNLEATNGSQFFFVQTTTSFLEELEELVIYKGHSLQQYLVAAYQTDLTTALLEKYKLYGGAPWLEGHNTVFGQIYEGIELLDEIAAIQTSEDDRPIEDVIIETIRVVETERIE